MPRFRVFRLDHNRVAVAWCLQKGHKVLARSMFFPHASGRCTNVGHLPHATTLDAFSNGFMAFTTVSNRQFNVRILDRFWTHVHDVFISDMNVLKFNFDHDLAVGLGLGLGFNCSLCLGGFCGSDFGQFAFSQGCTVKGISRNWRWKVVFFVFFNRYLLLVDGDRFGLR